MSFLRSLAQRARGDSAPALRPRVASRYETDAAPARLVEEHAESEASPPPRTKMDTEAAPDERPTLTPAPTARGPATPAPVASHEPVVAPFAQVRPQRTPAEPAVVRVAPDAPAAPAPAATPVVVALREPATPPPSLVPPASTLLVERVTERVVETRELVETREVGARGGDRDSAGPATRPAPMALTPVVAPARGEPAPMTGKPFDAPAGAPAIHVTIGRIDVRAVHAPPPAAPVARPAPPHAPLLSLEDYLARRAAP